MLTTGLLAAFPALTNDRRLLVGGVWAVALAAIGISLVRPGLRLVRAGATGCVIFSPLVPLLVGQMLCWSTWSEPLDPLPASAAAEGTPVIVFLFDGWSWARSTRDGEFLPSLPEVGRLCRQATLYRQAVSPYPHTMQSLPRFLFQTEREFAVRGGQTVFLDGGQARPTRSSPSLFTAAREHGYATYLLGWFHPYRQMFGRRWTSAAATRPTPRPARWNCWPTSCWRIRATGAIPFRGDWARCSWIVATSTTTTA